MLQTRSALLYRGIVTSKHLEKERSGHMFFSEFGYQRVFGTRMRGKGNGRDPERGREQADINSNQRWNQSELLPQGRHSPNNNLKLVISLL